MPISFSKLPNHIQAQIIQKISLTDRGAFEQSAHVCKARAGQVKTLLAIPSNLSGEVYFTQHKGEIFFELGEWEPKEFGRPTVRIIRKLSEIGRMRFNARRIAINAQLDDQFCRGLIDYFQSTGSTAEDLMIEDVKDIYVEKLSCSDASFIELLESSRVKCVDFNGPVRRSLLTSLPEAITHIFGNSPLLDKDLTKRDIFNINVEATVVTSFGINSILKDCIEGKLTMGHLFLTTSSRLSIDDIFRGIERIPMDEEGKEFDVLDKNGKKLFVSVDEEAGYFETANQEWKYIPH